jgi:hypothetical protein
MTRRRRSINRWCRGPSVSKLVQAATNAAATIWQSGNDKPRRLRKPSAMERTCALAGCRRQRANMARKLAWTHASLWPLRGMTLPYSATTCGPITQPACPASSASALAWPLAWCLQMCVDPDIGTDEGRGRLDLNGGAHCAARASASPPARLR